MTVLFNTRRIDKAKGPTGLRSIGGLIETLRPRGGGLGLFTGCAAGDTGAVLVLEGTS